LIVVMAGKTGWFQGTAVTAERHGLGGGDGRADGTVPEHSGDGDDGGGGQEGSGMVSTVEEEWDGVVPECGDEGHADGMVLGHGDGVEAVRVVAAWTRQCQRGHGKFLQPDGIQVKILWLGFKDRVAGGFIGGPLLVSTVATGMMMSFCPLLVFFFLFQ
jgi:hypothetical protein